MGSACSGEDGSSYATHDRSGRLSTEQLHALCLEKLRHSLFSGLMSAQQLNEFAKHFSVRHYPSDALVIKKGAPTDALFVVGEGQIRMEVNDPKAGGASASAAGSAAAAADTAKNLLCVKKTGEYFGEGMFAEGKVEVHDLHVVTSGECMLLVLTQQAFASYVKVAPEMLPVLRSIALSMEKQLQQLEFFKGVAPQKMKMLTTMFQFVPLMDGAVLFRENDFDREAGNSLYFLYKGRVKVTNTEKKIGAAAEDGAAVEEKILNTLEPGCFFGEVGLMMDIPRTATIQAVESSLLLELSQKNFRHFIVQFPEILAKFNAVLMEYNIHLRYFVHNPLVLKYFQQHCKTEHCLQVNQLVKMADGSVKEARLVRAGDTLAGETDDVRVIQALKDGQEAPASEALYRITHTDGSSYVVTGAHRVTCVSMVKPYLKESKGHGSDLDSMSFSVIDSETLTLRKVQASTCRVEDENDGNSHGYKKALMTKEDACVAAIMRARFTAAAEEDPNSLEARALQPGDLIEVTADQLAARFSQLCAGGSGSLFQQMRILGGFRVLPPSVPAMLGEGHLVTASDVARRIRTLVVCRSAVGVYSYRHLQAGDRVKLVFSLHNPLKHADAIHNNERSSKTFRNLQKMLDALHFDPGVNGEGGLVTTELNPISGDTGEVGSDMEAYDKLCQESQMLVLRELGATRIVSFGSHVNFRWQRADQLSGVSAFSVGEAEGVESAKFSFQRGGGAASADVRVWFAMHPCMPHRWRAISRVISAALGAVVDPAVLQFQSIQLLTDDDPLERRHAPIEVDGNHRFQLDGGILTHNSSENVDFFMACRDFRKLDPATQQGEIDREAARIKAQYIGGNAQEQVNLKGSVEAKVMRGLQTVPIPNTVFEPAEEEILGLMSSDSFGRFKGTELFKTCIETVNSPYTAILRKLYLI